MIPKSGNAARTNHRDALGWDLINDLILSASAGVAGL
jgi:hypothetical protein